MFLAARAFVLSLIFCAAPFVEVKASEQSVRLLESYYSLADEDIDLAGLKLSVDEIIDPSASPENTLKLLDEMTARIRVDLPANPTAKQKVAVIRRHIYHAGEWNDGRPFAYDLDDPLGKNLQNKLLATYFDTRFGNCVSMPILFLIQAERVGLKVTLSTAPFHIFVKYFDDEMGRYVNLETTDGANPARDEWIRQNIAMTDRSIESGIYMRTLSKREVIGVIGTLLLEYHWERGEYREVKAIADLILRQDQKNIDALVAYGSAAGKQIEAFRTENPDWSALNLFQRQDFERLVNENAGAFAAAEQLGWRPEEAAN